METRHYEIIVEQLCKEVERLKWSLECEQRARKDAEKRADDAEYTARCAVEDVCHMEAKFDEMACTGRVEK